MRIRLLLFITGFIMILCLAASGAAYYLFFTTVGGDRVAAWFISRYFVSSDIKTGQPKGVLTETLIYKNIEIRSIEGLPQESVIKIQALELSCPSLNPRDIYIKVDNGRLKMPRSEPVFFYGIYRNSSLRLSVYSNRFSTREILDLFAEAELLQHVSGVVADTDVLAEGPLSEPRLKGVFRIEKFSHKNFSITDCPASFDLILSGIKEEVRICGDMHFKSGSISGPKTAVIALKDSRILFSGKPQEFQFDLHGEAAVEDIKVKITLKGTRERPDLKLNSEPPLPKERLLLMLATNKRWKGIDDTIARGQLSTDLVKDFVDYFFFDGLGSRMSQKFGVNVSVKYGKDIQGLRVEKAINGRARASYELEQSKTKAGGVGSSRSAAGGEYNITDSVSIGVEREVNHAQDKNEPLEKQKADNKALLKYKKRF